MAVDAWRLSPVVVILSSIFLHGSIALDQNESCITPDGFNGICTRIALCPPLFSRIEFKPLSQSTIEFLKESQCRIEGKIPIVCCPLANGTLRNEPQELKSTPNEEQTFDVSSHSNIGLLNSDICGLSYNSRIVRGDAVKLNELPWMALLVYSVKTGSPFKCGGSIISEQYILTAAHCVAKLPPNLKLVSVRLGEYNLSSTIDCEVDEGSKDKTFICAPYPQTIRVEESMPHPKYEGRPSFLYDIALVRLIHPANFRPDSVRPICLPTRLSLQNLALRETKGVIAGWGAHDDSLNTSPVLLKASVPIVGYKECSEAFLALVSMMSKESQLCAGGDINNGDACSGDSGGPLIFLGDIQGKSRAIQLGIISYGLRNCSPNKPVVYSRVGYFMKWILDNMKP